MTDINKLLRSNVRQLIAVQSDKADADLKCEVLLNKNENAFGSPLTKWYNRYPDASNTKLKQSLAQVKNISESNIAIGNGSIELIDALYNCFCNADDNLIVCPPTYTAYEERALVHNVQIKKTPLLDNFQLNLAHLENLADDKTKMIWLCSPNNPTGNALNREDIETVLNNFNGIVVIDEAYINFSRQKSFLQELHDYPNLIVLQSLSIAWGLAGLHVSMLFASEEITAIVNKIKASLINTITEELCIKALEEVGQVNDMITELVNMRDALKGVLETLPFVKKVYPSDANFLLVKMNDATAVYRYLLDNGIAVSNQSHMPFCEDCLRITIGTEEENTLLVDALADYYVEVVKGGRYKQL